MKGKDLVSVTFSPFVSLLVCHCSYRIIITNIYIALTSARNYSQDSPYRNTLTPQQLYEPSYPHFVMDKKN